MPKAYWVAHVDVDDPATYENYKAANAVAFSKYGAKFIVRGGKQAIREGQSRPSRHQEATIACRVGALQGLVDPLDLGKLGG
ncbi:MAG: DUF1330 domain-containing protein, partial [Paracoccaceae bacterium]